jgi:hypothetical protein
MGLSWSQRHGFKPARYEVQINDFDEDTRTAIWNTFWALQRVMSEDWSHMETLAVFQFRVWSEHLNLPLNEMPNLPRFFDGVRKTVMEATQFWEILDLLEFVIENDLWGHSTDDFAETINEVFETKMVGYRVVGNRIVPLESQTEVDAVNGAVDATHKRRFAGVRHNLENAIRHLSDRKKPDYANSVKESISAVEGALREITGKTKFADGLAELEQNGVLVPREIRRAWGTLYGWASNEDGVRHAASAPPTVDLATARFMLVTCSAFVTYLVDQGRSRT